jgi:DNA-directed RNA polymerase subunit alpha
MAVKYGKFEMPNNISVDEATMTSTFARFIAEPFERGFGHTVGNSLRRILLSSLEAPAIVSVRIEGIPHEDTACEGIIEDMTNIVLNFKGALLRKLPGERDDNPRELRHLTTIVEVTQEDLDENKGQVDITLDDVVQDSYFEVVNPTLHLFTVTKPMRRQVDLRVSIGRGYVPSERHEVNTAVEEILIDSAFSPVRLVKYSVENTRVGQDTDLDRLILEVTTDGRVTPLEAVSFASQIAIRHFDAFIQAKDYVLSFEEANAGGDRDLDEMMEKLALRIDEIELSVRSANCLAGANIETIAELVSIPEKKMLDFRNFGKKSLNEIRAKLSEMGLFLGMDLSRFNITSDNVKDVMREYNENRKAAKEGSLIEE